MLAACIVVSLVTAPGLDGLYGATLAVLMIGIALIDARYFLIPNEWTAAAAAFGLLRAATVGFDVGVLTILIAAAKGVCAALPFYILMIVYRRWRGIDGLGLGDIKLAAVAGVWLGWDMIFVAIEAATLSAIAAYLFGRGRRGYRARAMLPFGLFLAPMIWLGWLVETIWMRGVWIW